MDIDYGRGLTNIDHSTGIRYGVISIYKVLEAWAQSSEPVFLDEDEDQDGCAEPIAFDVDEDGYLCHQSADDTDIFVIKSPFYTYCGLCSPCAPGAGDLSCERTKETGFMTYCFGHDWFEENKAPYPVYDVKTHKPVKP